MIIYQNNKYVVTQSKKDKTIRIGQKLPDGFLGLKWRLHLDKNSRMLTAEEGERLLNGFLELWGDAK